jgi:hypothetical protein
MEIIGEYIDRLLTVEMRPQKFDVRGKIHLLYEYARRQAGVRSLSLLAASKVIERVKRDDTVLVVTGTGSKPFLPNGESDGPLGSASIARACALGLGANPVFVVGENDVTGMRACARAIGLNVEDFQYRNTAMVLPFPSDPSAAGKRAVEILDRFRPTAVFSIETLGPNSKGIYHSVLGFDVTSHLPKLHTLFDEASARGILTIAGIDGGNELGSGTIAGGVRDIMPYGGHCQCPCGAGNACRVPADVVFPATTSNWALYGVVAMLACLLKKPYLLQDVASEHRMLEACVAAGVSDGMTFRPIMAVDGMSDAANEAVVTLLHETINNGLLEADLDRSV